MVERSRSRRGIRGIRRKAIRDAFRAAAVDKPPYVVPTLREIAKTPRNGLTVVSTFSGAGGSCLGFRMAGFKIIWASEFVDAARETYAANFPGTPLDARDVREVDPAEILEATGCRVGEIDVLEGSPPCASFSMAGKREKAWGEIKQYSDRAQRTDDLFFEFVRILRGLRPRAFVAENVKGLGTGRAKGYLKRILAELRESGYVVEARLLDAARLGVPQRRERLIFVGVREDVGRRPAFPRPLPYSYTIADAVPGVGAIRTRDGDRAAAAGPAPTIQTHGNRRTRSELTVAAGADISEYAIGREAARLAPGEQSARYINLIRADPSRPCPTVTQTGGIAGAASVVHPTEQRKFTIAELRAICSFPADFALTGTYRQQWERCGRAVPPIMMRAVAETLRDEVLT